MIIIKFGSWWIEHRRCLSGEKRQSDTKMGWDVLAIKLTTGDGAEGMVTCTAARNGGVAENYLHGNIAPVVSGRDSHDREAIFYELWNVGHHETFFPVFLLGPLDMALWDICVKAAGLPLHKYIGSSRNRLPVYASGSFHSTVQEYVGEALYCKEKGIPGYKAHLGGPLEFDMEVHVALRKTVGPGYPLVSDLVGEYTLNDMVRVVQQLERLSCEWFEEPFRDFKLYKCTGLCRVVDTPIAATETTKSRHWGVAQSIAQRAASIVRVGVSWENGVTGTLKVAHMVDGFGPSCEVHAITIDCMNLANVYVSCVIRSRKYLGYSVPEDRYRLPMKGDLPTRSGYVHAPDKPGIGAELDWELIDESYYSYRCQTL